jgi:hypothetical protein
MSIDARNLATFLAGMCESQAKLFEEKGQEFARRLPPDASEYDNGFFDGYVNGKIESYTEMAQDLRKIAHEIPRSSFDWSRISLGFTWRF